jgi:2-methylcitrate dehydratase PrpD
MSVTEEIIGNILETRFESFSRDIVERAKDEVMDTIGCIVGGANDTGCPMILELVREWGGNAESSILAHGLKAPSHHAAMVNAVMARSFDYGIVDMCVEGEVRPAHIGETVVPVALAVAEQKALGGRELLTALILGEDITSRIMAASNSGGGWDSTGTVNTFGAMAAAGKLWGLDKRQWLHAFGIALNQMGGTGQNLADRTHAFKLGQGLAAQRGIFSVRLASKGFTALKDPLVGAGGYFALYSPDYSPAVLTRYLGQKYYTEVTFKPYPCCRGTHAAVECSLEIVRKHHIKADDIDAIEVTVSTRFFPPILREPFAAGEVPHVSAIFSLQYTVASALLRGGARPDYFTEEAIRDPGVAEIIRKIKVTTQEFPGESFLAATVRVKMKNGREFAEHVNVPKGNELEHPMTRGEKREKFRDNIRFSGMVDMKNAEKALVMLEKLEDIGDITEIVRLLVA